MSSSIEDASQSELVIIRNAIIALSLAAFSSAISMRVADSLLPHLANEFSVSLGTASYVITVFSIAYGVAQLLFGPLGDRFGKYLVIAVMCSVSVLTSLLCAFAPNFPLLIVARLMAGASAAAVIPLSMAWIGDVIPYEHRQPVLARFLTGQIIGLSSGVLVGGLAADYFSWHWLFFGIATLFALISTLLFLLNAKLPLYGKLTRHAEGSVVQRTIFEFRSVLARPWARTVLLTVFLEGAFLYGAFAFIASHLHRQHHLSLTVAGALVMLYGLGGLLFAAFSAALVRKLGEVGLTRWGGGLAAASLAVVGLTPKWWWSVPACFVMGLGFYMLHNTLQINATQMAPERRGAAVSSFASCFFLGQSLGVAVAGLVIAWTGTGNLIACFGVGLFAVAWNFGILKQRHLAVAN